MKKQSAFKMKGFSGFGNSPVKKDDGYTLSNEDLDIIQSDNPQYVHSKERNRRLDILEKNYPEIVSQKGSPGTGYKKIKGTNIYKHPLGMKKGRDENLRYTFFGDTEKNRFEY